MFVLMTASFSKCQFILYITDIFRDCIEFTNFGQDLNLR